MIQETIKTDILVIGGGLAGVFAAIKARETGAEKVTVVSKGKLGKDSVSTFAAGVFRVCCPEDDRDLLFKKFALSEGLGGGLYHEGWLNACLDESYDRVLDMDRWGVEWEKTKEGKYERTEARWKLLMCMFHGPQMMEAIAKKVNQSGVEIVGHTMITDLLTENGEFGGRVIGALGFDVRTGKLRIIRAKATILAAGGCGFKARFAGHKFQTGDAYAMAYRAGAELGGFELGEILQNTGTDFDTHGLNMFIALGGKFINAAGERFILEYDPEFGDYATMARVAESSAMEVRGGKGPIYLDMTHFTPGDVSKLKTVLPIPVKIMERASILVGDKIVKKMEWAPAFYGTIACGGGLIANTYCETSLAGLYACGDAMWRPQSLPRALDGAAVSGARAGRFAAEYSRQVKEAEVDKQQECNLEKSILAPLEKEDGIDPDQIIIGVQEALLPYEVTVIARGDRLERAIETITRISEDETMLLFASDPHYLRLANESRNMVLIAEMYLKSRLMRQESRDSCMREDYPYTDNIAWVKWTRLKQHNPWVAGLIF